MTSFHKFVRAVAVCLYWFNVVRGPGPKPPTTTDRRRLRQAKEQMFQAFDTFFGQTGETDVSQGITWRRIVDPDAINEGRFDMFTQKFRVERFNASDFVFFSKMTYLLLAAAWTEG